MSEPQPPQGPRAPASREGGPPEPGLAPLLEIVAEEARQQAETLLADAQRQAEQRLREAERSAQEIEAQASATGAAEGEREAQRRIALARIETRRDALRLWESHVERAIELATRRLDEVLRGPSGAPLLAAAIRAAARALGETAIQVRARTGERASIVSALGAGLPAVEAWEEIDEADAIGVVVLSPDRHRMVDMTMGGLLRRRHDLARRTAAGVLFGKRDLP